MAERVIRPKSGLVPMDCRELWEYRELFAFLAWRDVLVRYKQTAIGILWAVIRPLMTMVVLTIIFGKLAGLPSNDTPYPLLALAGTLPWQFFANALTESSNSVVAGASMVSKIYFPRIIIPTTPVLAGLVDLGISFLILIGMMIWYHATPSATLFALPLFLLLAVSCAMGVGLWFSALNVEYRDVRHVVPFLVQMGLFVSPVGFSSSVVPEKWRLLFYCNPVASVIDGFRWSLLGGKEPIWATGIIISSLVASVLLVTGAYYFRRMERTFADVI